MKNIILLLIACSLFSCGKKVNSDVDSLIESEDQSLILTENTENGLESIETIDFGSIESGKTKIKNITIGNKSSLALSLDLSDLQLQISNTQRFSFISTTCNVILKPNKYCKIYISFTYSSDNYLNPISSKIISNISNPNYGKIVLLGSKKDNTVNPSNINVIQFGEFKSITHQVRYYIQNPNTSSSALSKTIPSEFVIIKNTCNDSLQPKKTCWIDLKLDPAQITNIGSLQKTLTINNIQKKVKVGTLDPNITQDIVLCNKDSIRINNQCVNLSNYYNVVCNCYENIPYTETQTAFSMDGSLNTGIGYQKLDLYIPAISNGKMVIYTHAMRENKELDMGYEMALKNEALAQGYSFISVEFRHPILEADELNSLTNQWDIINALKFARLNSKAFKLVNLDDIYSFSYSKGSLLLANITSNDNQNNDIFGRIGIKKMYIYDGQVTYNFDTYHQNFIEKANIQINIFISVSSLTYFSTLNDLAKNAIGFKLSNDVRVIDSLRNVNNETSLINNSKLPIIHFGYNHLNKNRLLRSNEVVSPSGVFDYNQSDYLLHNPQSATIFCGLYSQFKSCTSNDNLQYILDIQNIFTFFNN